MRPFRQEHVSAYNSEEWKISYIISTCFVKCNIVLCCLLTHFTFDLRNDLIKSYLSNHQNEAVVKDKFCRSSLLNA